MPAPRLRHVSHVSRFQRLAPVVAGDGGVVIKVLAGTPVVAVVDAVHDVVEYRCRNAGRTKLRWS